MPRSSQQDDDGIVWQIASLPLGTRGLDLRTPISPDALNELLNAHFQDERTVLPRVGHTALVARDGGNVASLGPTVHVTGVWVFGHGAVVSR